VRAGALGHGDAWSILFVAALALAFVLYVTALLSLRRGSSRLAVVCAIAVVVQLIPLGGPLLLSRDVYSYWAYARIASPHDRDPYVTVPATFPRDPATHAVAHGWRDTTSVYGPGFTATSIAVADAAGSPESVAFAFRTLAAVAAIGAALLAAQVARRRAFAAAFIGWNPLLAVAFAGGGHNDALMLVLILLALALARRRRDVASGAAWILAAAVKAPALFLLPVQLLQGRRKVWLGAALTALAGSVSAALAFGSGWLTALLHIGQHESRYALPVRLALAGVPYRLAHPAGGRRPRRRRRVAGASGLARARASGARRLSSRLHEPVAPPLVRVLAGRARRGGGRRRRSGARSRDCCISAAVASPVLVRQSTPPRC
jgi:hypothetical protein